jgi:type I site-specific restriction-modification system R (restriction) subunit
MEQIANFHEQCERAGIDTYDGLVLALEIDPQGKPLGMVVKQQGSPFLLLGVIDKAVDMLGNARQQILEDLAEKEKISKMVEKLPAALANQIKALEMRMRKAAAEGNEEEMKNVQNELDHLLESSRDNLIDLLRKKHDGENGGEFNPGDFLKGGL